MARAEVTSSAEHVTVTVTDITGSVSQQLIILETGYELDSLTFQQVVQSHLPAGVSVSPSSRCVSFTFQQVCQFHLPAGVSVSPSSSVSVSPSSMCASLTFQQVCLLLDEHLVQLSQVLHALGAAW